MIGAGADEIGRRIHRARLLVSDVSFRAFAAEAVGDERDSGPSSTNWPKRAQVK